MTLDKHEAEVVREAAEVLEEFADYAESTTGHELAEALLDLLPGPRFYVDGRTVFEQSRSAAWPILTLGSKMFADYAAAALKAERICAILNEEVPDE